MAGRGRGRGRGGGNVAGRAQILQGREMTWDYDPDLVIDYKPQPLYPPITLPEPRQIRPVDRQRVASFKSLRDRCRQGPFHAILGDNARVGKDRKPRNSDFFFKLSYQSTFPRKAPQYLPRFQTRRYNSSIFPEELLHVLDPKKAPSKARRVEVAEDDAVDVDEDNESEPEPEDEDEAELWRVKKARAATKAAEEKAKKEAAKEYADRSDVETDSSREDEVEGEEDEEDNFEDDEDEQAPDYNAEKYFDGGDGDNDSMEGDNNEGHADY